MELQKFIADADARSALAKKLNTNPGYLWQIATRWQNRRASIVMARKIEAATEGVVTKESLRPDVWGDKAA